MSRILHQMNSATVPSEKKGEPVRQIGNYFTLLTMMMKLGLQLIWEKQHGLKYFAGILDSEKGKEIYDALVHGVMHPEVSDSQHFHPQEIDQVAEKLSTKGMKTSEALDYIRIVIENKIENEDLQSDGDTHQPAVGWITPAPQLDDAIEFRDEADPA
jgi:hypothetical protein